MLLLQKEYILLKIENMYLSLKTYSTLGTVLSIFHLHPFKVGVLFPTLQMQKLTLSSRSWFLA